MSQKILGINYKIVFFLVIVILWPARANEMIGLGSNLDVAVPPAPERIESDALTKSLRQLGRRRYSPLNQGILVESLDGSKILAELNSDVPFNPASLMKLATSFAGLDRLGPDYRFHTSVYGDTPVDPLKKALLGNLFVISDGDPVLRPADARVLSRSLVRGGLRTVEGDLVVVGPFSLNGNFTTQRSAELLRRYLTRSGIRITGKLRWVPRDSVEVQSKILLLSHYSKTLKEILWIQNAHSVNEIADRLGDVLGGPEVIRQFLIDVVPIEPEEIYVSRPSGLEHNRITARATVKMLRELYSWLGDHQMKMQDIMPVAGIDEGTLAWRFRNMDCRGGILGKTGTNASKDGGISSLAGIAYTRDHGPVLYVILNTHGRVMAYRRWQEEFLKNLIEESGGVGEYVNGHEELVNVYSSSAWVPSEYWGTLDPEPEITKQPVIRKAKARSRRDATHRRYRLKRIKA
jgi:D-alanyl-D-alanine carboxypeptidase/D-alanyl-D-alanine-endopeptidase (penicillin-binding protein 4)